ncbi:MAG: hypothetical protein O2780_05570 [Proteobacteria bacterium]|nr:hypothetical protein [Pseudomonadota bacterium]MDA1302434.1 hypothetical protein [Pseudomonadota bacterium]
MTIETFDSSFDRPPGYGIGHPMAVALLAAALAHLLILYVAPIDWPRWSERAGLLVTLIEATPDAPATEHREVIVPEVMVEEVSTTESVDDATVPGLPLPVSDSDPIVPAPRSRSDLPPVTAPSPKDPATEAPSPLGRQLYLRAIQAIRQGGDRSGAGTTNLTESDFASGGSGLPVLVSQPTRVEAEDDVMGFVMIRMTDGHGNVLCIQERGDWGDWGAKWKTADKMKNPPLFYKVKEGMCGHMK